MDYEYSTHVNGKFVRIPKIDDLCLALKEKFNAQSNRIAYLTEENNKLKSEYYKDEELKKMRNEVEAAKANLRRGFPISLQEDTKIRDWMDEHEEHCRKCDYSYIFYPTEVVTFGYVKCACGEEFKFQEI